ncbi:MAG: SusC/RagA family TonB-linked outer membrane protein [Bacteroidales bacterium]|nr:SusC/RagA family TonB-linked outer membrane protein [Bacteroidales bacterium]
MLMKKAKLFFSALFVFIGVALFAQNVTVKGIVTDASNGETIPAASVVLQGTTQGVVADAKGNFSITVPSNGVLLVSTIGYRTVAVPVSGRTVINVALDPDSEFLEDVIVVAYGTASRASLTGSVAAVNTETIEKTISNSVTAALEGAAPGVQVNNTYGEPGSAPSIRIRGFGSINGSNSPLYVVDGFIFEGNIADLNSNDIESMTVLKDATSAALYGNKASNGVIIITTKKAKNEGKPTVTFTTNHGLYTRGLAEYERLGADDWMEMEWRGYRNYAMSTAALSYDEATAGAFATKNLVADVIKNNIYNAADNALFDANGKLTASIKPGYTDLDWEKELVKKGYRREYGVSFASSSDKYNVFASLDYMNEDGYILNTNFERYSARVNTSFTPVSWFKGGINLNATKQEQNYNSNANGSYYANPFYQLRYEAPIYPIYLHNADGSIILDDNGEKVYDTVSDWRSNRHIIFERLRDYERNGRLTLDASAFATFILPYGFEISFKANTNFRTRQYKKYDNPEIGDGATNNGRFRQSEYHYNTVNLQQMVNWSHDYGRHHIDAMVAHESYSYDYNYMNTMNSNMSLPGIYEMGNFTTNSSHPSGYSYDDRSESFLGRARYNFNQKYFFEASFRRDGSSRFSEAKRWGNFWSVGASWDITREDFMSYASWVDFLKLRASFGTAGNVGSIDYYAYQALYELDKNGGNPALYKMQLAAQELGWETSQTFDIGLDGRLFDRLNFSIGYFDKASKDLLFEVPLPSSAGSYIWGDNPYLTQLQNIGSVANRGWELSADVDIFRTRNFSWNFGLDATFLKNTIIKLPDGEDIPSGSRRYSEGHSIYEFYTYHFEGVDQMTGNSLYTIDPAETNLAAAQKAGKLVTINGKDYTTDVTYGLKDWSGSTLPTVYGSFHTNLSWKGFSLYVLATYGLGGKLMDGGYANLMGHAANSTRALHVDVLNSWNGVPAGMTETSANRIDPNGIPVYDMNLSTYNNATSDRWLVDASYLVLKNVTLSYTLPASANRVLGIQGLTINCGVENAFTLTKRQGINPQYGFSGGQDATYVTARIFNLGATLKF